MNVVVGVKWSLEIVAWGDSVSGRDAVYGDSDWSRGSSESG